MKYCSECGAAIQRQIPDGDNRERAICSGCGLIHYENPKILVTCMVHEGDRLLWMKRATEPRAGFWAIPGGFMEHGENLQQAACREFYEETHVRLDPGKLWLYGIGSLPEINQVYVTFRTPLPEHSYQPSEEALEVAMFSADELPWDQVAYPNINCQVQEFYRELARNDFGVYVGEVKMTDGVQVDKVAQSLLQKQERFEK